jgi:hypothetical protein
MLVLSPYSNQKARPGAQGVGCGHGGGGEGVTVARALPKLIFWFLTGFP